MKKDINAIKRVQSVDEMIKWNYIRLDVRSYTVSILADWWNSFNDDEKIRLCRNIKKYCDIENSFNQLNIRNNVLSIYIYYNNDLAATYTYSKKDEIELNYAKLPVSDFLVKTSNHYKEGCCYVVEQ